MTMTPKIGIIEDDSALREGLALAFELEGYETAAAGTMAEGWRLLEAGGLALLILDCNLPDGSGFDLVRQLRASSRLPVLMLTARDSEMDEVKGLELGVDDFMRKPLHYGRPGEGRGEKAGGASGVKRYGAAAAPLLPGTSGTASHQGAASGADLGLRRQLCG